MSEQQEQSEAKLLAYIEGELDDAGKAEIEKHLESNPHHRRMLDELARTRDMVRWLPREQAPMELFETFQAQLERSVLLEETSPGVETGAMRIHRWTQWRAIAAAVLLAAGLGVIVWAALPRDSKQTVVASAPSRGELADGDRHETASTPADEPAAIRPDGAEAGGGAGAPARPPAPFDGIVRAKSGEPIEPAAGPLPSEVDPLHAPEALKTSLASADATGRAGKGGVPDSETNFKLLPANKELADKPSDSHQQLELALAETARTAEQLPQVRVLVGNSGLPNDYTNRRIASNTAGAAPSAELAGNYTGNSNALYVVVASPDPEAASQQIAGYLRSNSIQWNNIEGASQQLAAAGANNPGSVVSNGDSSLHSQALRQPQAPIPAPEPSVAAGSPAPTDPSGGQQVNPSAPAPTAPAPIPAPIPPATPSPSIAPAPAVTQQQTPAITQQQAPAVSQQQGPAMQQQAAAPAPSRDKQIEREAASQQQAKKESLAAKRVGNADQRTESQAVQEQVNSSAQPLDARSGQMRQSAAPQQIGNSDRGGSINNVIVARRMTRNQAMELRGNVNVPTRSQYAEVFEATPPRTADEQTQWNLSRARSQQEFRKAEAPTTTQPAQRLAVATPPPATMPGLRGDADQRVAGATTRPDASGSLGPAGAAARAAALPTSDDAAPRPTTAPTTPARPTAAPTTPVSAAKPAAIVPPTQPAAASTPADLPAEPAPVAAAVPEASPSAPTTQPSEEAVDVVIVVQKAEVADLAARSAPSAAAPTTQSDALSPTTAPVPEARQAK